MITISILALLLGTALGALVIGALAGAMFTERRRATAVVHVHDRPPVPESSDTFTGQEAQIRVVPPPSPEAEEAAEAPTVAARSPVKHQHKCHIKIVNGIQFHSICEGFSRWSPDTHPVGQGSVVKHSAHWIDAGS